MKNDYIEDVFNIVDKNAVIVKCLPFVAIGDGNNDAEMIEARSRNWVWWGKGDCTGSTCMCQSCIYDEEKLVEFLERLL